MTDTPTDSAVRPCAFEGCNDDAEICGMCGDHWYRMTPNDPPDTTEFLTSLRGAPPIGTYVPIHPDGCFPGHDGFITRAEAEHEARRRGWDTTGKVVRCDEGWTTAEHYEVADDRE